MHSAWGGCQVKNKGYFPAYYLEFFQLLLFFSPKMTSAAQQPQPAPLPAGCSPGCGRALPSPGGLSGTESLHPSNRSR